jgi:hypothetical protein
LRQSYAPLPDPAKPLIHLSSPETAEWPSHWSANCAMLHPQKASVSERRQNASLLMEEWPQSAIFRIVRREFSQ